MTTAITQSSAQYPTPAITPHKRRPSVGPAFTLPGQVCFACFDTGIVSNHDRAINAYWPDYDVLPSGEILVGSDPAVICCCTAAYGGTGTGNGRGGGGFRDSSGPLRIETLQGPRIIGCELPKEAIAAIHRERRAQAFAAVPATAEQVRQLRDSVTKMLPTP